MKISGGLWKTSKVDDRTILCHIMSNIVESVLMSACLAANGTGSLLFTDDVTVDRSSNVKSE